MADLRNFRSTYLEKVGIKGVEEKKSIEILLKEQPLDLGKLFQFCLRFPVPNAYRVYLWKVLLGVLPVHQLTHEYVTQQRKEQYKDLYNALIVMKKIDASTPLPRAHLNMFLVEGGILPFEEHKIMADPACQIYVSVATAMLEITDDPVENYWLTSKFYKLQEKYKDFIPVMKEKVDHQLKKEDGDGKLMAHLDKLRAFHQLPLCSWFQSCYAGILPETSFERIWDKVIGGSCIILSYVAVAILLTFKRPILSMDNMEDILKYLGQIPEDSGDIIVSKAIDMWQKNGSALLPQSGKADSPALLDRGLS